MGHKHKYSRAQASECNPAFRGTIVYVARKTIINSLHKMEPFCMTTIQYSFPCEQLQIFVFYVEEFWLIHFKAMLLSYLCS